MHHYLDHAATSSVLPQAIEAACHTMQSCYGNPSSLHKMGIEAAGLLKSSRETVAKALQCNPNEVFFTAGGTESINTAIFGAAHKLRHRGKHIVTTAIEHAAVLQACKRLAEEGFEVTCVSPDAEGHILLDRFAEVIREDTVLVSMQLINNEVGTMLPVAQVGALLKQRNPQAFFHVDAVQGLFRIPLTPSKWNCSMMSVSGHKIGAPKGIGALYIRKGANIRPYLIGGGQESGMRSGTEPLPNIAAFAAACTVRMENMTADLAHVAMLQAYLQDQLQTLDGIDRNGAPDVPHVCNVSVAGCKSEVMLRVLESDDVFVSAGSACSKGKESPVLKAMELPKSRIDTALRISLSPTNTTADIDALVAGLQKGIAMLRR